MEIENLSTEQLEEMLAERKKKEQKEADEKRKKYEAEKDNLVKTLTETAEQLHTALSAFKQMSLEELSGFYAKMLDYGHVKEQQGNFSIKSADGTMKVEFSTKNVFEFDERADLADAKMKEFLVSFLKKRNIEAYEWVQTILQKDAAGKYDPKLIQKLYKEEHKYDHPAWKESIKLFKESYTHSKTANYIRFFKTDEEGKMQSILLNFSGI